MRRVMSSWASIIVVVTLAFALPAATQTNDYSYVRIVRLSMVEGDVQLLRSGEGQWETALMNMPIRQDYTLATGQGRAEVEFESGATARIAENTTLYFTELAMADGGRITRLTLQQGTATFDANLSHNDIFEVHTPHLATAVTDNARYRVDVNAQGSWVSVWKGDVQVGTLNGASSKVGKGRGAFVGASDTSQMQLIRNAEPDAWDRWVDERDSVILSATHAAQHYTNSPYSYGLSDLTYYGGWYDVPGYGYGWQPYGMPFGWSPFWNGRWYSMNGFGWTWVSYEPWGWLPYHFGSWTCLPGRGWFWVPGVFGNWNPAPVHWVQLGGHIGWIPRSPGDHPGGPPANLPQGPVVNTPHGFVGGTPNQHADLRPGDKPTFLDRPPLDDGVPLRPHGTRGAVGATPQTPASPGEVPVRNTTNPTGFTGRPLAPAGQEPGIVYDKNTKRFIDNPRAPLRPLNDGSGETGRPATMPAAPPGPASQPTGADTTRNAPMNPRNPGTPTAPDRPRISDDRNPNVYGRGSGEVGGTPQRPSTMGTPRNDTPRPNTPPPPQPRWESRPSTPPPPRVESPRPSTPPPPRVEPPRPMAPPPPPPRVEPPRPPSGGDSKPAPAAPPPVKPPGN